MQVSNEKRKQEITSAAFYSSLATCLALARPSLATPSSRQMFKHLRSQELDFHHICTTAAICSCTSTGASTFRLSYTQLPMVEGVHTLLCKVMFSTSQSLVAILDTRLLKKNFDVCPIHIASSAMLPTHCKQNKSKAKTVQNAQYVCVGAYIYIYSKLSLT